jgi:hypothetical protein
LEIAVICALLRVLREPIPPLLLLMALEIEEALEPRMPEPWQPEQYWL